jgi:heme O synthase-like polyprenyltransferase
MTPVALAFAGAAIINLVQGYRRTKDPFTRNRIIYPLAAVIIVSLFSMTNFLPGWKWYPVDQAGNLVGVLLISYAILRYRLVDVSFVLRKGFLYSVLTIFILAVFLCTALLFGASIS